MQAMLAKLRNYSDRWEDLLSDNASGVDCIDPEILKPRSNLFTWSRGEANTEAAIILKWTTRFFDRMHGVEKEPKKVYDMLCICKRRCFINKYGVRVLVSEPSKPHYTCEEIKDIP